MSSHRSRLHIAAALALCVYAGLAGCTVNPVPTPAKTAGGGAAGNEDNKGIPTGTADATDPGKAFDGADAARTGAASDAAPPAADGTATADGTGEIAGGDGGRAPKD